jgi:hypothetical protein
MTEPFLRSSLKAYGTSDKREFERYAVEAPVKVQYQDVIEYAELLLRSVNISAGGILLSGVGPEMEGKTLNMEIDLPLYKDSAAADGGKMIVIRTTGMVVRSGPEGAAIRFNKDLDIRLQPGEFSA